MGQFGRKMLLSAGIELVVVSLVLLPVLLVGCGGGASNKSTSAIAQVTQLVGTNGDMNKYVGAWVSGCGIKYNISTTYPFNFLGSDGVVNRFDFTGVSGAVVQGTLTSDKFVANTYCSGTPVRTVTPIAIQFASNVVIASTTYTGTADLVDLDTGVGATPYYFAFRLNFSQFQLKSSSTNFSSSDLLYVKQ